QFAFLLHACAARLVSEVKRLAVQLTPSLQINVRTRVVINASRSSNLALLYLYFALAASVAIMAMIRGRPALVWFLVAVFATPLIAGLLVMALPKLQPAPAMSDESGSVFSSRRVPMPENSAIRIVRRSRILDPASPYEIFANGARIGTVDRDRYADFRVRRGQVTGHA